MITEEEIEKAKENILKAVTDISFAILYSQEENNKDEKILLQYIEQLETEKQNLIEKLEEKDKIIRNLKKDLFSGERFYRV